MSKKSKKENISVDKDQLYKAFLEWKAKPITADSPLQTYDDFCEKNHTNMKELQSFQDSPGFHDDLVAETLLWAKGKTPELIHTVYNQIKLSKSVNDLARFMELVHGIKEKKDSASTQQYNFFNNLTPEQYESIIRRESRLLEGSSE